MSFLLQVALTQSLGVLFGLLAVYWINPTTNAGGLMLIVMAVVLTNVIQMAYKYFVSKN